MKVLVAIDNFRGSLTSMEAGNAAKTGILKAHPEAEVVVKPVADGGPGTVDALYEGIKSTYIATQVTGPMGDQVFAKYLTLNNDKTAIMEMAQASGLALVKGEKDPWKATSIGTGQMIMDAVRKGCREFIIGIGGSATTDCGIGMLRAFGYHFLDENGVILPPVFESLGKVASIDDKKVPDVLKECHFQIACDVANPLCGVNGALYVYGPGKGVKHEELESMEESVYHFAEQTAKYCGTDYKNFPGAGAAGGLGFAMLSYLPNVEMKPGVDLVLDAVNLEEDIKNADIVVTGEGRIDFQTTQGKVPTQIAKIAKKYGKKVIAFSGVLGQGAEQCNDYGIDAYFTIIRRIEPLDQVMEYRAAYKNMRKTVEQVFRLL